MDVKGVRGEGIESADCRPARGSPTSILKRGSSGVCTLWSVTETNQNPRERSI